MYGEVVGALSGARTFKEHITALQKILDRNPVDPILRNAITAAITELMHGQANAAKRKVSSQKLRLDNSSIRIFQQLLAYCKKHAASGEPEWMVAARHAGWTPPAL